MQPLQYFVLLQSGIAFSVGGGGPRDTCYTGTEKMRDVGCSGTVQGQNIARVAQEVMQLWVAVVQEVQGHH